jgi:deoxyribodipyrimidine photo-lyase
MEKEKIAIFWFRRDLRWQDNVGLYHALQSGLPVLPIFIFDTDITDELPVNDARVGFIYDSLQKIHESLVEVNSSLLVLKGKPETVWKDLLTKYNVAAVYSNKDYEPYARKRDEVIQNLLQQQNIPFHTYKDQVIFEENEVLKNDGKPYTVYTPYKNKWLEIFEKTPLNSFSLDITVAQFFKARFIFPSLEEIGFKANTIKVQPFTLAHLKDYDLVRNDPAKDQTSYLSPHLRFGTVSVRQMVEIAQKENAIFLSELIWREFFMQILFHFPQVVQNSFKPKYDSIPWRNNEIEFKAWHEGKTGYPMVDAGMRQLNETGYMHNRVRMITAGFLCKHLLIDWRWGEAYFAKKLLDYDLSANNGNWQWAAGTGCDAAPYFRVFNPTTQLQKFDPQYQYVKKWVRDLSEFTYPNPIVPHDFARKRAIETYKKALE